MKNHDEPQQDLIKAATNEQIVSLGFHKACDAFANTMILAAIERNGGAKTDGSKAAAARELQMSRELLNYHLRKMKNNKPCKEKKTAEDIQQHLFPFTETKKPTARVSHEELMRQLEIMRHLSFKTRKGM